jgi:hypothetical protein
MSTLSTRVGAVQDRIQDSLADMKPRDRALFLGLVFFAMVTVAAGSIWWMRAGVQALEAQVAEREDTLRRIELLAADNAEAEAEFVALSEKLAAKADVDISSFMEKAADKVQIREKLDSVRRTTETDDGIVQEAIYAVKLSDVSQQELANFLAEVEGSDMPMRIRSFKAKLRKRKGESTLHVDMDISSYKVVQDASGEAE